MDEIKFLIEMNDVSRLEQSIINSKAR